GSASPAAPRPRSPSAMYRRERSGASAAGAASSESASRAGPTPLHHDPPFPSSSLKSVYLKPARRESEGDCAPARSRAPPSPGPRQHEATQALRHHRVPVAASSLARDGAESAARRRRSVSRKRSEEHTSELQSRGHLVCR